MTCHIPEYYEVKKIKEMLRCIGIRRDLLAIKTVQILLKSMKDDDSMKFVTSGELTFPSSE